MKFIHDITPGIILTHKKSHQSLSNDSKDKGNSPFRVLLKSKVKWIELNNNQNVLTTFSVDLQYKFQQNPSHVFGIITYKRTDRRADTTKLMGNFELYF
jgi:hypothetical protein